MNASRPKSALTLLFFFFALFIQQAEASKSGAKLIVNFQGRGTDLGWGLGISKALVERLPAVRTDAAGNSQAILAGNSSGSILAAYFACHGFSSESVAELRRRLSLTDPRLVNEEDGEKLQAVLRGTRTEFPTKNLDQFIALALSPDYNQLLPGVVQNTQDSSKAAPFDFPQSELCPTKPGHARPFAPIVITAANYEVLDTKPKNVIQRLKSVARMVSGKDPSPDKEFNDANFSVKVKSSGAYLGKGCTYFVDQTLFDLMSGVPYEQRLCDLRLMKDGRDLRLALQASTAEPTYFYPVPEPDVTAFAPGDRDKEPSLATNTRAYSGGFLLPTVAQDIRRILPDIYVMGTGWTPLTGGPRLLMREWQLVDVFETSKLAEWWLDLSLVPPKELDDRMIENRKVAMPLRMENLLRFAMESENFALTCFDKGDCQSPFVQKPTFDAALETGEELKTQRGLTPLLEPASQVVSSGEMEK